VLSIVKAQAVVQKRIGLIIPSSNRMVETEMVRAVPAGATAHVARLRMTGQYNRALEQLLPDVTAAAATLADAKCDAIAFHCTANSTSEGEDGEAQLLAALQSATPGPVTTTATAIRNALDAFGAKRIVLVTPYSTAVTDHEAEFFHAAGYDVVATVAKNLAGSDAYCSTPSASWEAELLAAQRDDADAYVLSCANIACFDVVERVEARLERPVVTSNQSVLWATLRAASAPRPEHLGRLMQQP
jgi:maleate isomerase